MILDVIASAKRRDDVVPAYAQLLHEMRLSYPTHHWLAEVEALCGPSEVTRP